MKTTNSQQKEELALLIVAAGSSSRMGGIKRIPSLRRRNCSFYCHPDFFKTLSFSVVAVTFPFKDYKLLKLEEEKSKKALFADSFVKEAENKGTHFLFVPGGKSRQESVFKALGELKAYFKKFKSNCFYSRRSPPICYREYYKFNIQGSLEIWSKCARIQPVDTQNEIDGNGFIKKHLLRSRLTAVQTPQVFRLNELLSAHEKAVLSGKEYTDDTEIWDLFVPGGKVKITEGDVLNKKITYKQDISQTKNNEHNSTGEKKMLRTGLGYDKHALVQGRPLMLGGIKIESDLGEDGHSDGDVLLHAITDALLGASAMGDIGSFFPPGRSKVEGRRFKNAFKHCLGKSKS